MKSSKKMGRNMAFAAALAFSAVPVSAVFADATAGAGDVHCSGVNACKGQGACKGSNACKGKDACKGKNACKGTGIVMMKSADECVKAGGKVVPDMPVAPAASAKSPS